MNSVNQGLISYEEASLWIFDPIAALQKFSLNKRRNFISNLLLEFEVVGFSDGAWNVTGTKGGIGGVIFDKHLN